MDTRFAVPISTHVNGRWLLQFCTSPYPMDTRFAVPMQPGARRVPHIRTSACSTDTRFFVPI